MNPPPIALGLTLCDHVIVEKGTDKISLIGMLTGMTFGRFPSEPRDFYVFAALTNGLGDATIELGLSGSDTDEEMLLGSAKVNFPNKLSEVELIFRVEQSFPSPGRYPLTLLVDREWIAQRHFDVSLLEDQK